MVTASTLVAVGINGLAYGVVLALLGVSITLVFGLGEVLNLATGVFSIIAVLAATTLTGMGIHVALAGVVALVVVALVGIAIDQSLFRVVYRSEGEERILLGIFVTLGLAVFLQGVLTNLFPSQYFLPVDVGQVPVGTTTVSGGSLLIILAGGLLVAGVFAFLQYTFLGKAARTIFQDEKGAQLVGVKPRKIRTLIFVLSAAIAGFAGLVYTVGSTITVASGFQLTTFALIVSIVGGVRSVQGAVVAGVLLGTVNQFANFFVGSYLAVVILFTTAIVAILVKPEVLA